MKYKLMNIALIATSLLGYLEWGRTNSMFLLSAEADIITKLFTQPSSVLHPFVLMPLVGQLILLATLFQKQPRKVLTFTGIGALAVLLLFIFFIGIITLNIRIFASTLPFIITCIVTIMAYRKKKRDAVTG